MTGNNASTRLVVFSDDWGRHPSSCQHLIGKLLPRYPTLWVNTIGTRSPRWSREDLGKITQKLRQWITRPHRNGRPAPSAWPDNLTVVTPPMWPGFRRGWQRWLNASSVARVVNRALGPRREQEQRVAITTLAVTADMVGPLDVDRWIYYCVDDFSVWPGLDGSVLQHMERQLVGRVDSVIAVSETLQDALSELGHRAQLLTHGIDLDHWALPADRPEASQGQALGLSDKRLPDWWRSLKPPIFLFWGLIDRRLDTGWCRSLSQSMGGRGSLVLIGPKQSPDPLLETIDGLAMPGPVAYQDLPWVAAAADVLIMPYADLPVTRAMQPLKFKEYLATGKPVVVRDLPAMDGWSDAADVVDRADRFVKIVHERAASGTPSSQESARVRLAEESWQNKAALFEAAIRHDPMGAVSSQA